MASKHVKACSISLIIRKMEIETIVRYHNTSIRMATKKETYQETDNFKCCLRYRAKYNLKYG